MGEDIIKLQGITKVFPGVVANDHIDLSVRRGEIHSLAGENGAGKSTLMGILYGLQQPDEGSILLRGEEVRLASPKDAIRHGLGMVHQHFMLIPKFTVTQNIILGMEVGSRLRIDYPRAEEEIRQLSQRYGLGIDPTVRVSELSVTMQQRVEILKILYRKAEILIFDEPTAVLTPQEIDEFCDILTRLRDSGKTILFISHKLAEVEKISDRVTVIRRGRVVGTLPMAETNQQELATLMVGREVRLGGGARRQVEDSGVLLDIRGVHYVNHHGVERIKGVDLQLHRGEILGVAGVDGNGQEELENLLCGKRKPSAGTISFLGQDIAGKSVKEIKKMGMGVIFEDRHKDGLVLDFSVRENLILGFQDQRRFLKAGVFLDKKKVEENARRLQEDFDIRCGSLDAPAGKLSGGNQQKIIIAREMSSDPEMVMAIQPTRGLDLGAVSFVQDKLVEARNQGKGVLLFSLELDEVLQVSDRIAVIFKGQIVKVLKNEGVTKEQLGAYMLGVAQEEGLHEAANA
ncbi:ABC transporter ATP-binding protein [Bittarella massiliensis (ex Durand et al. 2017)]|uniref:ABC transporter ATP-binding protein n=1 Tax=Bittarella massiliensis (ex Durand et al. 2017) TaxID=1720313 RepID=UPI001AA1358C|nr:ABC transporter ATP-binding protein [Bittarella massiliensis (ex Durand et al. 2017)]MBO1680095.1 ABC transporter ATP-binding protein [Bittarella massiliensis (ex Durand et al. 2017)]